MLDAEEFIEWLIERTVKLVLHGHKYIPLIMEHKGIIIVSCGLSTGLLTHKEKNKSYIS